MFFYLVSRFIFSFYCGFYFVVGVGYIGRSRFGLIWLEGGLGGLSEIIGRGGYYVFWIRWIL